MTAPAYQRIALTFADDTIGFMSFITDHPREGWTRLATAENVEAEIAKTAFSADKVPVKRWWFIDESEIPQDRRYRNALRHSDVEGFHHDLAHARELHRADLRHQRAPLLAALDVEYQRADEASDAMEKRRVADTKQRLRDAPSHPAIEGAASVEQLAALTLDALT